VVHFLLHADEEGDAPAEDEEDTAAQDGYGYSNDEGQVAVDIDGDDDGRYQHEGRTDQQAEGHHDDVLQDVCVIGEPGGE